MEEVKQFNKATIEVLDETNIRTPVFNKSVKLYMITSQDSLLQAAKLSLYTPFKLNEECAEIDQDEALEKLEAACGAALELVK